MSGIIKKFRHMDQSIFIPFVILSIIGIIMVYSSSSYIGMTKYNNAEVFFIKQAIFFAIGLIIFCLSYSFAMRVYKSQKFIMGAVGIILMMLVYLLLFAEAKNGSKSWIDVGLPFNLQPAEFAKFVVIWYLSFMFSKKQQVLLDNFKDAIFKPLVLVGVIVLLIFLQPDMGTSIIFIFITAMMVFSSGVSPKIGTGFSLAGITLLGSLTWVIKNHRNWVFFMKDYQYNRFLAYWDPFKLAQSTGMQLVNSYYALSRGGLFGVGLGESVQKTGYLPEPYTDFIFSIIGEELGLIGITLILSLFIFLVLRVFLIGIRARDPFHSLFCIGTGSMMMIQAAINLGGVLGLMPITGVTFPFISYGGSSMLLLAACMGVVCNISVSENKNRMKEPALKPLRN